ncbi:MAG: hypothetical protein LBD24_04405 [Spirochaetaceae bacterium]|nr:hypothetical protein [Spirochaetaceae bacterium]
MHHFQTTRGHAEAVGDGGPNNDQPLTTHNNAQLPNSRRLRESVAAPQQQPDCSTDRVLHHFQTTRGHAEAVGDGGVLHHFQTTGGHAVPPAAGGVLHHFQTTRGHAGTAGGCRRRRAGGC